MRCLTVTVEFCEPFSINHVPFALYFRVYNTLLYNTHIYMYTYRFFFVRSQNDSLNELFFPSWRSIKNGILNVYVWEFWYGRPVCANQHYVFDIKLLLHTYIIISSSIVWETLLFYTCRRLGKRGIRGVLCLNVQCCI